MHEVTCTHCGRTVHVSPDAPRCSLCGHDLHLLIPEQYAASYFYRRAADQYATYLEPHLRLGSTLAEMRAYNEAIAAYQSAVRIDLYEWRARPLARRGIEYVAYALRKLW